MMRSEEHTSELQSPCNLVCRLLLEKKKKKNLKNRLLTQVLEPPPEAGFVTLKNRLMKRAEGLTPSSGFYKFSTIHFFCVNDTATTEIYTLSLHDALPI